MHVSNMFFDWTNTNNHLIASKLQVLEIQQQQQSELYFKEHLFP